MTLTQLRYIIAIADAGLNITLAAERVHATQPGISRQLRQLEDELGFQFFLRKGKSLDSVTSAGAQVIARARVILAEAANIRVMAANLRSDNGGQLVIVTTHTQARFVLPDAVAEVKRHFPDIGIRLEPHGDTELIELLGKGVADLAIISTASWAGVFRMPSDTISVVAPAGGWGTLNHTMNPLVSPSDTAAAPTRAQVTSVARAGAASVSPKMTSAR